MFFKGFTMSIPADLRYTKEHEWVRMEGDEAVVGITAFAAEQLGDVVFVELPEVGASLEANGTFGVVESVKSVSDLYVPISGEVVAINEALSDSPEQVNEAPYGDGWMIRIKVANPADVESLLDAAAYGDVTS
ncbi:putative glycine cleavage system protein H [Magnetofaba australis IT-1]|uniref:Glycine cleavage system H protein n=2 Tax=Magnetofaba TaxID=1472292 RepID=A0A1Y2JZJ1_9PROT|nr:putative glycine cleavage system protein H [Magnetofaba australis IT-1]